MCIQSCYICVNISILFKNVQIFTVFLYCMACMGVLCSSACIDIYDYAYCYMI